MQPQLECPQCNRIEMVVKVSAIVAGGSTSGIVNTSGNNATFGLDGSVYLGGTNRTSRLSSLTAQARQLSPPARPSINMDVRGWGLGAFVLALVPTFIVAIFAKGPAGTTFAFVVYIVSLAIGLRVTFSRYKQKKEARDAEIRRWERAMARWNHLFYCSRCDGVFDVTAAQRRLIPTSDMMHYLSLSTGK